MVYTDHKPLIYLKTFRDIVNKRFRWISYLETMNAKILYIPGKENILSDYISRNLKIEENWSAIDVGVVDLELLSYNKEEVLEKQMNDPEINCVIKSLKSHDITDQIDAYCI